MLQEAIYELNKNNPEKSEILIQGYGRLGLDSTKKGAISRLEEAIDVIKKDDTTRSWKNAYNLIYRNGVIESMFEAIIDANEELDDLKINDAQGK